MSLNRKRSFGIRYSLFNIRDLRSIGFLALMGFVLFVSFRIFHAPTETVQVVVAPDGSREARLQYVYYYSDPGFKVAVKKGLLWNTLLYLPEYTNSPVEEVSIRWSADSRRLWFDINQQPVWKHDFSD